MVFNFVCSAPFNSINQPHLLLFAYSHKGVAIQMTPTRLAFQELLCFGFVYQSLSISAFLNLFHLSPLYVFKYFPVLPFFVLLNKRATNLDHACINFLCIKL